MNWVSIGAKQARQNNQMPVLVFAGGFGVALSTAVHTIELSPALSINYNN